ncbi:MAG: endonuclease V [bacterium]|nr:MAG: endonuclease V [bacterium]
MDIQSLNEWDLSPREALRIQTELAGRIRGGTLPSVNTVLGVDVSYRRADRACLAAAVLMELPGLALLRTRVERSPLSFPYVPGLLSFREIPPLLPILKEMPRPDLIIVDGQGIAHPRGLGLASHIGLITGVPTVGCAKSLLVGRCEEPGREKGDHAPIIYGRRTVGYALRSREGCRPLYVSPGHLLHPLEALKAVTMCLGAYRLPEPTRLADRLSRENR